MNKLYDNFINLMPQEKTLRFELKPIGETLNTINKRQFIKEDLERSKSYFKVTELIDKKHKLYIEEKLSTFQFDDTLKEYIKLYESNNKEKKSIDEMKSLENKLRKQIADKMTEDANYKLLFGEKLIKTELYNIATEEEKEHLKKFEKFTGYFKKFLTSRENMYSHEKKSTAISYRIINDNLPIFLDNISAFKLIKDSEIASQFDKIKQSLGNLGDFEVKDYFTVDFYNFAITQKQIDTYNELIGGRKDKNTENIIEGLNQLINKYNQKKEKKSRLPLLKKLHKQILSDKESLSFIPKRFSSDSELLNEIKEFFENEINLTQIATFFNSLDNYNLNEIYIKNDNSLTFLSNEIFKAWGYLNNKLIEKYNIEHPLKGKKTNKKYEEERKKYLKSIDSYNIAYLEEISDSKNKIIDYYKKAISEKINSVNEKYKETYNLLNQPYPENSSLISDEKNIELIKNLLDSTKELQCLILSLKGSGKENNKDNLFYGEFEQITSMIGSINKLYDKVRNYLTQKPFSTDKIKINFSNPSLLSGFDVNKESDYSAVIFRKDNLYYLGILLEGNIFKNLDNNISPASGEDFYEKMIYKQISGASKYLSSKQINPQNPPKEITCILEKKKDKKPLTKDEINTFINYIKDDFLKNYNTLKDKNGNHYFNFNFKKAEEYETLEDFYEDVEKQAYRIRFINISTEYIDSMVKQEKLLLFQIYNKDFSKNCKKHGKPNLHTMYWNSLFDEENLKNVVYKLNGNAEIFWREKSIEYNSEIMKKGFHYNELKDKFVYPIIKDKRYTEDKFFFHVSIKLNYKVKNSVNINNNVIEAIKNYDNINIIGIDRGERNLLYISVIDINGKIIDQISLNKIKYNEKDSGKDYHELLDNKEQQIKKARQNWKTIEKIKELKEGYLSQAIHKIVQLMIKHNAIIVMEDLNYAMKNSRIKFEKQVYQKFENMLISKLQYYVNKEIPINEPGGLMKAYQLANKVDSVKNNSNKQNGFIFYVPAWNTSKIDPVTGFCNLFNTKLDNKQQIADFFSKFDFIKYNSDKDYFEFSFRYSNFGGRGLYDSKDKWTVCSYGNRIKQFRNPEKNNQWDSLEFNPTEAIKILFDNDKYKINLNSDNLIDYIKDVDKFDSQFYEELLRQFKYILQLRNSKSKSTAPEDDYIISPVCDDSGKFYDSRKNNGNTPCDADANGAYNIARKGIWIIKQIKNGEKVKAMTNKEWLSFVQNHEYLDRQ